MTLALVLGGTRSGKSAHAEALAAATGLPVRYVATASNDGADPAMATRIAAHAARRPADWTTVEVNGTLDAALADRDGTCVLLDGLGVWIAAALHRAGAFEDPAPARLEPVREAVVAAVERLAQEARAGAPTIVVAEQAGEGLLPPERASRVWLDLLGEATQRLAAAAERVELVVAGRPLALATGGTEPPPVDSPSTLVSTAPSLPPAERDAADLAALRHHGDEDVRPGDADYAVNVVAGGPPAWLRDALADALAHDAGRYPDERAACAALAILHGRTAAEIVPANGAAGALWLLPAALRPRLAACVHPAFTEAEAALHAHGVPVVRVQRDPAHAFALDPAAVPDAADLVIVGNPASPSGTLDPADALLALRRPGRVVVVDEAFMDLVPGEPASLVREPLDDVIVVRSLTKALGIPGLRAGYAVAAPALAARLRAVRQPWAANALALAALAAAADRPDALAAAAERARAERTDLAERLSQIAGVRTWPGAANFCLVEVADGPAVLAALRARAIAVRPAASFPGLGANHLRITARTPAENERLATALVEAVA